MLTEAITKHPHSVLLLDEIEKAHPDVFNLLLQVMDHGTLTDNNGRKADFRHVIIVMTTNAGRLRDEPARRSASPSPIPPAMAWKRSAGSSRPNSAIASMRSSSSARWRPVTIERVVDKLLVEVEAQLEQKGVSLTVDDEARAWIARKGYDPKMGARPMARLIQDHIKRPLAEDLLFGKLVGGGHVRVTVNEDGTELALITRAAHEPELLTQGSV